MCGIAGFWDYENLISKEEAFQQAEIMSKSIQHRGPDGHGFYWNDDHRLMLIHRRLAIIDLNPTGQQPMFDDKRDYSIVFNGEIYNFKQLKQELQNEGITFRSSSDTEVLLNGLIHWGVQKTLEKCEGMFAFCFLDLQQKKMYLGRDRIGEKPLYYGEFDKRFYFSSELKSFFNIGLKPKLNNEAVNRFLSYGYVPGEDSILAGFQKLKPAHFITIDLKTKSRDEVCYWNYTTQLLKSKKQTYTTLDSASTDLENELTRVVEQQMISDVPLGAFLSGGIDSSLIVSLMSKISKKKVQTFTIGFNDQKINEAHYANQISKILGTDHTELYLNDSDLLNIIPDLSKIYDEPFADASQVPTFLVSQLCRKKVTVSLSGDAGDELFGGYDRYVDWDKRYQNFSKVPKILRHVLGAGLGLSSQRRFAKYKAILKSSSLQEIYDSSIRHWHTNYIGLLNTSLNNDYSNFDIMQSMDIQNYLPDDILVKVDRAAMANSLETRIPFLNHKLIELSWKIPFEYKINNGKKKFILKNILSKYVPQEVFNRPKQGFAVPLDTWLRTSLKEWAYDLVNRFEDTEYITRSDVLTVWNQHQSGLNNSGVLWDILMLQDWKKRYAY